MLHFPPDVSTLRLCSILASLAFAAVFLCVWGGRRGQGYLLWWSASSASYALILGAFHLEGGVNNILLTTLLYGMLPASNLLLVIGVRQFHNRSPLAWWMVAPIAAAMLCHFIPALLVDPSRAGAAIVMACDTIGLAIAMTMIALALLLDPASRETLGQRIAGFALLAYVPAFLLVIVTQLVSPARINLVALVPMLADQLLLSILNLGLLAMPGERAQQDLRQAALRDPLTRAWNRAGLGTQLRRLFQPGATVIVIDLDRFKQINDSFGHAAGDEILMTLAALASRCAAEQSGEIARLGGDEFVAILPRPGAEGARRFVGQLQQAVDASTSHLPPWTISLGMAKVFSGEDGFEPALQRADLNLYRAKAGGRNRAAA